MRVGCEMMLALGAVGVCPILGLGKKLRLESLFVSVPSGHNANQLVRGLPQALEPEQSKRLVCLAGTLLCGRRRCRDWCTSRKSSTCEGARC